MTHTLKIFYMSFLFKMEAQIWWFQNLEAIKHDELQKSYSIKKPHNKHHDENIDYASHS